MLEINDDDEIVATDIIHNTVSIKRTSYSMDPPLFLTLCLGLLLALMIFLMVIMI